MAGGGGILPMRDDADVLAELVKENENFNENEPQVAANIGQQMFHMDPQYFQGELERGFEIYPSG